VSPHQAISGSLWWALRGPLRLAGSSLPGPTFDFPGAFAEGLTQVISLLGETNTDSSPLVKTSFVLQDLYGIAGPADNDVEWEHVTAAASTVRGLLDDGEGVLVHCRGGTGRTGTVIGAVLASYGMATDEISLWLDSVHKLRGQHGWPESPWQRQALGVLQKE
jgi:hypothetical protein